MLELTPKIRDTYGGTSQNFKSTLSHTAHTHKSDGILFSPDRPARSEEVEEVMRIAKEAGLWRFEDPHWNARDPHDVG